MTALLLLLAPAAQAQNVFKTGDVCVEFTTGFLDLAGDSWTTNADRPARGVWVEITDAFTTQSGWLDDDGCWLGIGVWTPLNNGTIRIKVRSEATVNGVELESWQGYDTSSRVFMGVTWPTVSTGAAASFSVTKDIPLSQRYTNLAVGTYTFHQFPFSMSVGTTRDCCLEGSAGYLADGTCPSPATGGYELLTTPVQFMADLSDPNSCCGSSQPDGDPNELDPPGVVTGYDSVPYKFSIAHELGHVIAGMKTGGKEWGQYDNDHALDQCNGDYKNLGGGTWGLLSSSERGEVAKEALGTVFREGWANFVAAAVFNDRGEQDCEFQAHYARHDFDLDGDIDDDYTTNELDGSWDCEGIPSLNGVVLESYVTDRNWLEDLEDADDNNVDLLQCVADPDPDIEVNRSSVADFTRMFWDLTSEQLITPADLASLYVDTCPRGWAQSDTWSNNDELPIERLWLSAYEHGLDGALGQQVTHLVH